ncbi:MAG: hypothetical protein H7333_04940 [Bdellovibrionales bacterium]|nr:hypothetical protein [Oligoflexia bacterium]
MNLILFYTLLSLSAQSAVVTKANFDPALLKQVDQCKTHSNLFPTVYLLKQWHLPPQTNTRIPSKENASLPQTANQEQIYNQLSTWVKEGVVDTVIAEGCEGEIDSQFKEVFQGWSFQDLEKRSKEPDYSRILAHPVVKLEAKYGAQVRSLCGDNSLEIKNSQLALSDARAAVGYYSRLNQFKDKPELLKPYLEGARQVYTLPETASVSLALKTVAEDFKKSWTRFEDSSHQRNLAFSEKAASASTKKPIPLVIGGLHVRDLKKALERKKLNCVIFEPLAYQNDEETMQDNLKKVMNEMKVK